MSDEVEGAESTAQDESTEITTVLLGVGLGVLVGAVVALLFAPKSGRDTREDVAQAAGWARDRAETVIEELKGSLDELSRRTRDLVETYRGRVDAAVEAGRQAADERKAELQARVEEAES